MLVDLTKSWHGEDMACLRRNPEMFFFSNGKETLLHPSPKVQAQWDRAKEVCATCPVIKQCARDSLGEIEGVWGGLDPSQRIRMRKEHAVNVRAAEGEIKIKYATMAYGLREEQGYAFGDIARIMGFDARTAQYLHQWYKDWHKAQEVEAAVVDLELPEADVVVEIHPNAAFPDSPPAQGDGWVRYGRRVVYGYYLGQTEDDQWFNFKLKLLGPEYSVCWIKAEDVKLTRPVARNVLNRVGRGSRIYGTALTKHRRTSA